MIVVGYNNVMKELDTEDKIVNFWNDLLKIDTLFDHKVPTYISVNKVLDEAKKQGLFDEKIKNLIIKPVVIPEYGLIVDKLGYSPDKGIAELVWLFNFMGINTCGSCEGHPEENRGSVSPYLNFNEKMAIKALTIMDGWKGVKTGDVVFSRMIGNEFGDKGIVKMDFMDKLLVGDLKNHIMKVFCNKKE